MKKLLFILLFIPVMAWGATATLTLKSNLADVDVALSGTSGAGGCTDPVAYDISETNGAASLTRLWGPHGQSILATETGTLYSITLNVPSLTGTDTVEMRVGAGPDLTTVYESQSVEVSTTGEVEFIFNGALSITNGELFYFGIDSTGETVNFSWDSGSNNYYTDGQVFYEKGNWNFSTGGNSANSAYFRVKYCD